MAFKLLQLLPFEVEDVRCGRNNNKVLICKNGRTRCVRGYQVAGYLNQGSTLGPCSTRADYDESTLETESLHLSLSPNPFSEKASIQFYAPETDQVKVSMYNLNGKMVKSIYQGAMEANEMYQYDFNRDGLSRGIYLIRMTTAKGKSQFQKVIIQ